MCFKCIKYNMQSTHLRQNEVIDERDGKMEEFPYTKVGDYLREHCPTPWVALMN